MQRFLGYAVLYVGRGLDIFHMLNDYKDTFLWQVDSVYLHLIVLYDGDGRFLTRTQRLVVRVQVRRACRTKNHDVAKVELPFGE